MNRFIQHDKEANVTDVFVSVYSHVCIFEQIIFDVRCLSIFFVVLGMYFYILMAVLY